jgi:tRNA pseudouridine32 synthase / 23S rRNA pseudouridine746 synthase
MRVKTGGGPTGLPDSSCVLLARPAGVVHGMRATEKPSRWQLPPGPWTTVLDGLCARFPAIRRATWIDRFARGRVLDDRGVPLCVDTPYRVGLELRYYREVTSETTIPFEEQLVFVDEHLVVADKPHFLPVTPSGGYVRETLLERLIGRLGNRELVPLHRIDRETAGLVLFSACERSRGAYQALFRERRISKRWPHPGLISHSRCGA